MRGAQGAEGQAGRSLPSAPEAIHRRQGKQRQAARATSRRVSQEPNRKRPSAGTTHALSKLTHHHDTRTHITRRRLPPWTPRVSACAPARPLSSASPPSRRILFSSNLPSPSRRLPRPRRRRPPSRPGTRSRTRSTPAPAPPASCAYLRNGPVP